jgi:hypothetical protein
MVDSSLTERLDALIQLLMPPVPSETRETDEIRVLRLCDHLHDREAIAKEIGKPIGRIDVILNTLRRDGRIRSVSKDGRTVYVRLIRNS